DRRRVETPHHPAAFPAAVLPAGCLLPSLGRGIVTGLSGPGFPRHANGYPRLCRWVLHRAGPRPAPFPMPRILIADDSRFQRQLLASFLGPKGFEAAF